MFGSDERLILLDVGIVRFEERDSITPDHADRLGTPDYGSPEQLDYDKDLQSIRTDILSTGIVMFESVTGIHPYDQTSSSPSQAILSDKKVMYNDYLDEDEPITDLNEMFTTMTEKQPFLRYPGPEEAMETLAEIKEVR
jgi:serine/threonine-protein kinase